ncbi:hypothetical protein TWF281_003753 [Arthrobotrys megalospora]
MPSVLDPYVQDYTTIQQYPPILPDNPQRAYGPAPYCIRGIRANTQGNEIISDAKFLWPARCDENLMKQAVIYVPKVMNRYLLAWLDKTGGKSGFPDPDWYFWYHSMLSDLHRYRFWHSDNPIRWEFSELAAALDPRFDALRCKKFIWVWRPEMKWCIKDLKEFQLATNNLTTPFGTRNIAITPESTEKEMRERGNSKLGLVTLCFRSPVDETVIHCWEDWDFKWGQYTPFETDYWNEEQAARCVVP